MAECAKVRSPCNPLLNCSPFFQMWHADDSFVQVGIFILKFILDRFKKDIKAL